MRREQKCAWFVVAAFVLAAVVILAMIPKMGVYDAWPFIGLFGFGGLGPLLFRGKPRDGEVAVDERDRVIAAKATLGSHVLGVAAFILATMIPWAVCHARGVKVISIEVLPSVVGVGMVVTFLARAVIILWLYGWGGGHGDE